MELRINRVRINRSRPVCDPVYEKQAMTFLTINKTVLDKTAQSQHNYAIWLARMGSEIENG